MTKQAGVALNRKCLSLRLDMQFSGDKIFVRFPVVGRYFFDIDPLDGIP